MSTQDPSLRQRNQPHMSEKSSANAPPSLSQTKLVSKTKKPPKGETTLQSILHLIPFAILLSILYYLLNRSAPHLAQSREGRVRELQGAYAEDLGGGHWDFGDGRESRVGKVWREGCEGCFWVNTNLGNGGPEPDLSGGMIPAVAPPFGMTRWTPQTRQNYVSMCPYNQTDTKFHGFIGTHQPAIWMGESGQAVISAGLGQVKTDFDERGLEIWRDTEYASPNYYRTVLEDEDSGLVLAEMSASSRVGHLRFTFLPDSKDIRPHIIIQASRPSVIMSGDNVRTRSTSNVTYPMGSVTIDEKRQEVYGWNDERQDRILLGEELPAKGFKGYFVARFSQRFNVGGTSFKGVLSDEKEAEGKELAGWVAFPEGTFTVEVRIGVSFISIEQARRNLDLEIPDGQTLEQTSNTTRSEWTRKLDLLHLSNPQSTPENSTVLYSSLAHTYVYPYEIHESTPSGPAYYSGYLDRVVQGESYSGYSIWDTFRAEWGWLILTAPERVAGMINSMLADYTEGGWLPMWKNLVESNIMVGTHADVMIAQAMMAGVKGFDYKLAWEAVRKNAYTPPDRDTELRFEDREEHTPQEVRAGLTEYMKLGYVAADLHSESGSRTFDYAYDDWAASIVARHIGAEAEAEELLARSRNWRHLFNEKTGFMEARNSDGSWAGEEVGWTEGDHWAYSLDVMHDIPGLIEIMGGNTSFISFMNRHFEGGHNLHTNEPSHHIPYLYNYAGAAHKTQEWVRKIGEDEYNHTAGGLSGNEDCGQMSAWYIFSSLGFYPVDPASATYTIGTPFFDQISLRLPGASRALTVTAQGASSGLKYIKSVTLDGRPLRTFILKHDDIKDGADLVFEMSDVPESWPSN